jgi:hypothetical protein
VQVDIDESLLLKHALKLLRDRIEQQPAISEVCERQPATAGDESMCLPEAETGEPPIAVFALFTFLILVLSSPSLSPTNAMNRPKYGNLPIIGARSR